MTKYYHISSTGINWNISRDTPTQYKLRALEDYVLLNPYHYSKAYVYHNLMTAESLEEIDGCFHLYTNGIILKKFNANELDYEELPKLINSFFRYIRFESMQVSIQSNDSISWITTSPSIQHGVLNSGEVHGMRIRLAYYKTMVTWINIKEADRKLANKIELPVYEEMLLDAYKSLLENEYNKVILFSVIATESLLAHTYDKVYEQKKNMKNKSRYLRFTENRDGSFKDPIVKLLLDRTDFKKLLHEIPLYLLNRSLLVEKEQVYQNLIKLYNTRNKIVHWGAPIEPDPDKLIQIDSQGAEVAMKMAIETFNWLDIKRYNHLLINSFIKLN